MRRTRTHPVTPSQCGRVQVGEIMRKLINADKILPPVRETDIPSIKGFILAYHLEAAVIGDVLYKDIAVHTYQ